jgi:hypothetical protein
MSHIEPHTVVAPKNTVRSVDVLYTSADRSWSVARLSYWNGEENIGIRWNGEEDHPGVGHPQSRGRPVWFVIPQEMADTIRARAEELNNTRAGGLMDGYRAMLLDTEREAEAQEWSEGLIDDANGDADGQEG